MKFIKLLLLSIALILFAWSGPLQASPIAQLPSSSSVQVRETTSLKNSQDVLTVATFNVENLDPADQRFDKIAKIIVNNLKAPDVIGLVEIQDNNGTTNDDPVLAAFTLPENQSNASASRPNPPVSQPTPASNSATILPQLSDLALVEQLALEYAPSATLNYDRARDQMFGIIDNQAGIVIDIYASYPIRLTGSVDPSKEADGLGLNTEHTWPQSKGADKGNAQSDLHHLFPARKNINSDRGNKPFDDIADASTERWYRDDVVLNAIPSSAINQYSEVTSTQFEPREKVKGNIARAMFYFYTIYRDQADKVDPNYFDKQRQTLCKWNQQDPPDSTEIERSHAISQFQGNDNPFVLDVRLAEQAYCNS